MHTSAYITRITCYLPEQIVENELTRLTKKTGILRRHIARKDETAADLAVHASEKLFSAGISRESIDFILLCTQSPDYILPTTACVLQDRLRLPRSCGALDYNLGCSGYIYGLGIAKGLIEAGLATRVLLLTAETYSKYLHPEDQSVVPLFGDAASATLIEGLQVQSDHEGMGSFSFGTDGSGAKHLIIPSGGAREPYAITPEVETCDEYGNRRTNRNIYMFGAAISDFALSVTPLMVDDVLKKSACTREDIDYFVFHQANKFILQFLQQKCNLLDRPFWNDLGRYANTVSCSIPLALHDLYKTRSECSLKKVMLAGFGVGLSWGGCIVNLEHLRD